MLGKTKKRALINAAEHNRFWTCDGRILQNLPELRDALKEMGEEDFRKHANKEKNDFALWIEQVLQDTDLAGELKRARTQKSYVNKIDVRLKKFYQ